MTFEIASTLATALFGLVSAGCWLRAATVTVSREKAIKQRKKAAEKRGETPNLAGVELTIDGQSFELFETITAQTRWNARGALYAATAVLSSLAPSILTFVCWASEQI